MRTASLFPLKSKIIDPPIRLSKLLTKGAKYEVNICAYVVRPELSNICEISAGSIRYERFDFFCNSSFKIIA